MMTLKYYWLNWDSVRPMIEHIEKAFPCWVSICQAFGYVRIECRREDEKAIKNLLKNC